MIDKTPNEFELDELSNKINAYKRGIDEVRVLENVPFEFIFYGKLIIVLIFFVFFIDSFTGAYYDKKIINMDSKNENFEKLHPNETSNYNFLSKKEIYEIRKKYVRESIFAKEGYEPKEEIFGSIQDNKPWWGNIQCTKTESRDYFEHIQGNSKVSSLINNPNALVGLSLSYLPVDDGNDKLNFCKSEFVKIIPSSIKYNKKDKIIVAVYDISERLLKYRVNFDGRNRRLPIQLSGLNARDFGYQYVRAIDLDNVSTFYFGKNNIDNEIKSFQDYISTGFSCRYEGGCNNICPMQNDKTIEIRSLPSSITLKLWKKMPNNKYKKADMYYKIIFRKAI